MPLYAMRDDAAALFAAAILMPPRAALRVDASLLPTRYAHAAPCYTPRR